MVTIMLLYKCEMCNSHLFLHCPGHLKIHKRTKKHREGFRDYINEFVRKENHQGARLKVLYTIGSGLGGSSATVSGTCKGLGGFDGFVLPSTKGLDSQVDPGSLPVAPRSRARWPPPAVQEPNPRRPGAGRRCAQC